ncbi:MAG: ABC transporter ATP-binding protein [Patescibacteria group bacterium]|nr:ABC transporter ATP-binding protein [Patescibacteria group bacterium]
MIAIEVKNLIKHFGVVKAVDKISFKVKKGEIFGFLGPNGAGKTTTIRMMMDFIRADGGEIKILDKDSRFDSIDIKQELGYLAPQPRLYENWTGDDHLQFIARIRGGMDEAKRLIEKFDFNPKVKIRNLSSGNRQKLSLILALMSEPKVLILDELTTGLDPLLQNAVYKTLEDYKDKGVTIFLSSHNLPEVQRICDRAAIIKAGKLMAVEDIKELKKKHIYDVRVFFESDYELNDFKISGVEIKEQIDGNLKLIVKGDINNLLKILAKYKLRDLEINHGGLEDIFLEFYKN